MSVNTTVKNNNENLEAAVFGGTRWGQNGTKNWGQAASINVSDGNNQITLYFPKKDVNVTFKFDNQPVTGQADYRI